MMRSRLVHAVRVCLVLVAGVVLPLLICDWMGSAADLPEATGSLITPFTVDAPGPADGLSPQPLPPYPPRGKKEPVTAAGDPLTVDPRIVALLEQDLVPTLLHYERALTGMEPITIAGQAYTLTTRHSYSEEMISLATQYVYDLLKEDGLDVAFHTYTFDSNHWRNVVAELQGGKRSRQVYLITAHLDDMPPGPVAPGADDNASGAAGVLVAAKLLGRLDFDCTIRFVLFTGEEQGLRGSAAYAADLFAAGEDVRGVLNLDMIGYNSDTYPIVDLHTRRALTDSLGAAATFSQVVTVYGLDLTPHILVDHWLGDYSDNKSFWDYAYPAILAIEDWDDFTPYYHTVSDTLDSLDTDYFAEFSRAALGTLAHMGCLSKGELSGAVSALDTGLPVSTTVTALAPGYVHTATTDASGFYHLSLPVYTYTVRVAPGVPGYLPAVVTGMTVQANVLTTYDFSLEPWPNRILLPVLVGKVGTRTKE
jgi:hypothetical protein